MIAHLFSARAAVLAAMVAAALCVPAAADDFRGGFHGGFNNGFQGGNAIFRHRGFPGSFGNRFDAHRNFDIRRGLPVTQRDRLLPIDRRDFRRRPAFANNGRYVYNGMGYSQVDRRGPQRINQIAPSYSGGGGSSVTVVLSDLSDYGSISSYGGSGSVYSAGGGTYVIGSAGYPLYGDASAVRRASGPRVIDVARMRSPCSYEHGVCVIRP